MKRIIFDLTATQPIGNIKYHGGGKYGVALFKHLCYIAADKIAAYYDKRRYIEPIIESLISDYNIQTYLKEDYTIIDAARKEACVIYTPLFYPDLTQLPPKDITVIFTQHGLRMFEMPHDKYESAYMLGDVGIINRIRLYIRRHIPIRHKHYLRHECLFSQNNIHFVTVSEHSKYSILSFFPKVKADSIKVFYSPSTITFEDKVVPDKDANCLGKYWLIVSGNRWLKNSLRAIIAFDELFSERTDFHGKVVITGLAKWDQIRYKIKHKDRFILKGYVDEKDLYNLYKNAYALVYPSLNEGFGYPPLEAMCEGCPVIASAISSIPEVCGDSVLYFNPYLISELKMRILNMEDSQIRSQYITKGYKRFSIIKEKQDRDLEGLCSYILSFIK